MFRATKGGEGEGEGECTAQGASSQLCPTCGSTLGAIDDKPVVALVLGSFDSNNRRELAPAFGSFTGKMPSWMREG